MDISFIVPIFNNSVEELKRMVNSVQALSSAIKYEIVIVDDGSTKDLSQSYKRLALEYKINYFKKDNGGVSSARNYGLKRAKGRYVVFLDADDQFVANDFSLNQLGADLTIYDMERENIEEHKSYILNINNNNQYLESNALLPYLLKDGIFNSANGKVYSKDFLEKNNIKFDINITVGEDLDFISQVLLAHPSINYISKVGYRYLFKTATGEKRIKEHPIQNLNDAVRVYKLRQKILKKIDTTNNQFLDINLNNALIDDIFEIYSQYLQNDRRKAISNLSTFTKIIKKYNYDLSRKRRIKANLIIKERYGSIITYIKLRQLYKKIKRGI